MLETRDYSLQHIKNIKNMKKYHIFTAFSGYDSQMMALRMLSDRSKNIKFELVGWAEIEPAAIAAHNAAFPEYSQCNYGDISKIDWAKVPDFDIFTYSFPCQAVSKSGKSGGIRKGSNTTSSLLWECERAIEVKRPKYCIMENVKALVTKQKTKKDDDTEPTIMIEDFLEWEFTMCTYGYWNYLKVLDAADFGVPQHRERTIMVSIRKDNEEAPHYVFPVVQNLKPTTIDSILDDDVSQKNYLPDDKVRSFIAILASDNKNILPERMPVVKEETIKKSHLVKKIITPTTKNGHATTLMASSYIKSRDITYLLSTGHYPKTGVVEIRKSQMDLECEKVNWGKLSAKYKKTRDLCNNSREEILSAVRNLNGSQFIRLRDLTAAECLRLMSVPKEYVKRMLNPEKELMKINYTEEAIKSMMMMPIKNEKTGKVIMKHIATDESALKKMAGNSIVVDMLFYVFKSLLIG